MEINGDVTDAGRTNDEQGKIGLLSQMDAGWLSSANIEFLCCILFNGPSLVQLVAERIVLVRNMFPQKISKRKDDLAIELD